ncbi:MAG: ATP-binding protein [Calditrichota bacterium]
MKLDLSRFADKFRLETRDNLARFDASLTRLERFRAEGGDEFDAAAQELPRIVHAIKGAARMLGFQGINNLCHSLEELLIAIRAAGRAQANTIDLVVETRRAVERLLSLPPEATEAQGVPYDWLTNLHARLKNSAQGIPVEPVLPASEKPTPPPGSDKTTELIAPSLDWRDTTVRVDVDAIDDILLFGRELGQALEALRQAQNGLERLRRSLDERIDQPGERYSNPERLMTEDAEIGRQLSRINYILRDRIAEVDRQVRLIDAGAVELRMRPIQELYETIPLQVRDLAQTLKKEVVVNLTGGNVRLDGRIIDMLGEPLVHIIRNHVDHGLESPEERVREGKSREGQLFISAKENAGWVRIMVADDGRGIDLAQVWARAYELGLAPTPKPEADRLRDGFQFLFSDRFTSRKGASDISGRGVGLNAVKKRLQELRGDVQIESDVGLGTRIILTIPTSLSSQRILVTSYDLPDKGAMFVGIPTAMVRAAGRLDSGLIDGDSDAWTKAAAISLRRLLTGNGATPPSEPERYGVEITDGFQSKVVAVRRIVAETEAVIEPLPALVHSAELIAGAAPVTSEQIMLILNVPRALQRMAAKQESVN